MKSSYRWTISTIYFYVYNATPTVVPQIVTLLPAEAARPRFSQSTVRPKHRQMIGAERLGGGSVLAVLRRKLLNYCLPARREASGHRHL